MTNQVTLKKFLIKINDKKVKNVRISISSNELNFTANQLIKNVKVSSNGNSVSFTKNESQFIEKNCATIHDLIGYRIENPRKNIFNLINETSPITIAIDIDPHY